jgi:hypothetical protein
VRLETLSPDAIIQEINERIKAFKSDIASGLESVRIMRKWLPHGKCFALEPEEYYDLKQAVADATGIHSTSIFMVGSGKLGFSIHAEITRVPGAESLWIARSKKNAADTRNASHFGCIAAIARALLRIPKPSGFWHTATRPMDLRLSRYGRSACAAYRVSARARRATESSASLVAMVRKAST